jgi:aminoglycoside 6'-N-acetyltransferase I
MLIGVAYILQYIQADASHAEALADMAVLLWSDADYSELLADFRKAAGSGNRTVFLCIDEGNAVGFAEFSVRHDYVEGAHISPVGYIEAVYVREQYRKMGIARDLIRLGEQWAKERGCLQMASDCELPNETSRKFHLGCGFSEANRIICFIKDI